MRITSTLSLYAPANRKRLFLIAIALTVVIAGIDYLTESYLSLGFLYLFPIMLVSGFLSRMQVVVVGVFFAILQEVFSNLPAGAAIPRLLLSSAGFIGAGLFLSELMQNRRIVMRHIDELECEMKLRQDAEEQLRRLVESSPAAIITINAEGVITLANDAAQHLLAPRKSTIVGDRVQTYLPALDSAARSKQLHSFRTALQCRGTRPNGEVFLAGVWFSTYESIRGKTLAAIIVDVSDDLRNREDLSLDYLLKNTRILMSAVSHEIRNLCGAALVVHKNLTRVAELSGNPDFEALGSLIQALEKLSSMELRESAGDAGSTIDLVSVLDELRVLLEAAYQESEVALVWDVRSPLPRVHADRYELTQVFLNLAKNSLRAMQNSKEKRLLIRACHANDRVLIRFEDTGEGIANPENLFRPFQRDAQATGLGLYISRALMKSFGGDLVHEAVPQGCAFTVSVQALTDAQEAASV
jgi:two-component system sensor kinase FixL